MAHLLQSHRPRRWYCNEQVRKSLCPAQAGTSGSRVTQPPLLMPTQACGLRQMRMMMMCVYDKLWRCILIAYCPVCMWVCNCNCMRPLGSSHCKLLFNNEVQKRTDSAPALINKPSAQRGCSRSSRLTRPMMANTLCVVNVCTCAQFSTSTLS